MATRHRVIRVVAFSERIRVAALPLSLVPSAGRYGPQLPYDAAEFVGERDVQGCGGDPVILRPADAFELSCQVARAPGGERTQAAGERMSARERAAGRRAHAL